MAKLGQQATSMFLLLIFSIFSPHQVTAITAGNDNRLVAFLGNWQSCPTTEQLDQYTHIAIAFAVSYSWAPAKNICNTNCDIGSPVPVCNNQVNQNLVDSWRAAGKKVTLSFGGAGMGGSWAGDVNNCWDYCFDKASHVVSQLVDIVTTQNFDGVDIDYEYFYNTTAQQNFLRDITTGLKASLPAGQNIVTHVPMDSDLVPVSAYYNILKEESDSIDFIMAQYYNGITRPAIDGFTGTGSGWMDASTHFDKISNEIYNNEPNRVVFGFCVKDCSGTGSNTNSSQAAQVMADVARIYPCNGGAFFWIAERDTSGTWSSEVGAIVHANSGCSDPIFRYHDINRVGSCRPNKACPDGLCCSKWGYCGSTEAYCGTGCLSNCWEDTATTLTTEVDSDGTCEPNKSCSNGLCCSQWGHCGSSEAHCGTGCQSNCRV
eukprot:CAMPEP_0185728828 /NCGR_PEP_ID=MMETSP1171-20130828/4230_1 /TAXON_ID=374046 /ORGANISM="Helicotheca tamensis, Strain CCMP826" /LENGTH=430 /DNA_ID=CAMNT_0028397575 /DNA_START=67 /DNA_END=1359 /DNA_ORIENTATION=-